MAIAMTYVFVGGVLLVAWGFSEFASKNPQVRIALGGGLVLVLVSALFVLHYRHFREHAYHMIAIQELGIALEKEEIEAARGAINEYNSNDPPTGKTIVRFLRETSNPD